MGNAYWAGAFPGLLMATVVSVGLARGLTRPGLKHIVWLVPLLHFVFALAVGPAVSLAYGLIIVPAAGALAGWLWLAGCLVAAGGLLAASRLGVFLPRAGPWPVTVAVCLILAGVLIPPFYQIIAG